MNLKNSFNNLLVLEKKAVDIYGKMAESGLDKESLEKIKQIRIEELNHVKQAKALVFLEKEAGKRKASPGAKTKELFKRDFAFKNNLLKSINRLIDTRIETMELLAFLGKENKKAVKINKIRQDLVDKITHDIKNPLTVTMWFTESLLTDGEKLSSKQKKMVKGIEESNQSIISFVEDLLLSEKVEEKGFKIKKEKFDLAKLAKETISGMNNLFKSRGQKVILKTFRPKIIVNTSKDYLKTIISNLLANASQYGGKNNIDFKIKKDKQGILISVSDKGIGIPKKQQGRIFKKFFRADNAKTAYNKGTGLGLYLVKGLVEKIGGKIWFESEENKGTIFYVSFK